MTTTYNPSLKSDKDRFRFLLGDTNMTKPLFQDEEIAYLLTVHSTPESAAISGARQLAARFTRLADTTIETVSVKNSERAAAFRALADDLQNQYDRSVANSSGPSATGISIAGMDAVYQDTDRRIDDTRRDQFSNPPNHPFSGFNKRIS